MTRQITYTRSQVAKTLAPEWLQALAREYGVHGGVFYNPTIQAEYDTIGRLRILPDGVREIEIEPGHSRV